MVNHGSSWSCAHGHVPIIFAWGVSTCISNLFLCMWRGGGEDVKGPFQEEGSIRTRGTPASMTKSNDFQRHYFCRSEVNI